MPRKPIDAAIRTESPAVVMRNFIGMAPNQDPHDVTPGVSLHQVNVIAGPPGELRVRLGCQRVYFDLPGNA